MLKPLLFALAFILAPLFAGALNESAAQPALGIGSIWSVDPNTNQNTFEQNLGAKNFEAVASFPEGSYDRVLASPVGKLVMAYSADPNDTATCTASVIASDLILTNRHCYENDGRTAAIMVFQLGYIASGMDHLVDIHYPLREPVELGQLNRLEDYAIFRLSEPVDPKWGVVQMSPSLPSNNQSLIIVQHPQGQPQQIAKGDCAAVSENAIRDEGKRLFHRCDTDFGSSGSPVFMQDPTGLTTMVALHHAAPEPRANAAITLSFLLDVSPTLRGILGREGNPTAPANLETDTCDAMTRSALIAETEDQKLEAFFGLAEACPNTPQGNFAKSYVDQNQTAPTVEPKVAEDDIESVALDAYIAAGSDLASLVAILSTYPGTRAAVLADRDLTAIELQAKARKEEAQRQAKQEAEERAAQLATLLREAEEAEKLQADRLAAAQAAQQVGQLTHWNDLANILQGPSFYCYDNEDYIPSQYICADENLRRLDAVNGFLYFGLQDRLLARESDQSRLRNIQRRANAVANESECMSKFEPVGTRSGQRRAECLYGMMETQIDEVLWPLFKRELSKTNMTLEDFMGDYAHYPATDIRGNDIAKGIFDVTLERCEQLCEANSQCRAFTHVSVNETFVRSSCWLKSATGPRRAAESVLTSAIKR